MFDAVEHLGDAAVQLYAGPAEAVEIAAAFAQRAAHEVVVHHLAAMFEQQTAFYHGVGCIAEQGRR